MPSLFVTRRTFRGRIRAEVTATVRRLEQLLAYSATHESKGLLNVEPSVDPTFSVVLATLKLKSILEHRLAQLDYRPR